jgi:antitoxin ParD1/3/4
LSQPELEDVMTAYKKYVKIKDPKSLVLNDLPFKQGQVVEVVMTAQDNGESEDRVRDLQALLKETQALPQAQAISEDEIAAEIEAYRAGR